MASSPLTDSDSSFVQLQTAKRIPLRPRRSSKRNVSRFSESSVDITPQGSSSGNEDAESTGDAVTDLIQSFPTSPQLGEYSDNEGLMSSGAPRKEQISGIPITELRKDKKYVYSGASPNLKSKGSVNEKTSAIPTAESLNVMMERARGDAHTTTYSGMNGYATNQSRKLSYDEDGLLPVRGLTIKRKTPPAWKTDGSPVINNDSQTSLSAPVPITAPESLAFGSNEVAAIIERNPEVTEGQGSSADVQDVPRRLSFAQHASVDSPQIVMFLKDVLPSDEALAEGQRGGDDTPDTMRMQEIESYIPNFCPVELSGDIPGYIPPPPKSRHTHESSTPSMTENGEDSELDNASDDELEDISDDDDPVDLQLASEFPVPNSLPASPTKARRSEDADATPRLGDDFPSNLKSRNHLTAPVIGATPQSYQTPLLPTPRTDVFKTNANKSQGAEWDLADELEIRDRVFRAEMGQASKADKQRRLRLKQEFDTKRPPTAKELYEASLYSLRDEYGNKIRFGTLFEKQRTVVCFIRHFWCSQCQDYVDSIAKVKPAILEKYGVRLIVISNGSWKMIKPYKKLLGDKCPYPIYTDRGKHLYTALGMTLRTWNAGKQKDGDVGKYITHSLGESVVVGVQAGLKMPMKPPGDQQQLGGEFILGPGLQCKFTHRMKSTRNHAEIEDVLAAIDIDLTKELETIAPTPALQTPMLAQATPSTITSSRFTATTGPSSPTLSRGSGSTRRLLRKKSRKNPGPELGISSAMMVNDLSSLSLERPPSTIPEVEENGTPLGEAPKLPTPQPATPLRMSFSQAHAGTPLQSPSIEINGNPLDLHQPDSPTSQYDNEREEGSSRFSESESEDENSRPLPLRLFKSKKSKESVKS